MSTFHNLSIFKKIIIIIVFVLSGYAITQSVFVYLQINDDFQSQKNKIIVAKKAEITEKMNMVYELAKQVYQEETKIENITKNYQGKLKAIIDSTMSGLEQQYQNLKQQGIDNQTIQAQLKDYLRKIRYDNETGYIFTYNLKGIIISHADTSLENQFFLNKQDAIGKYFVQEFMDIGKSPEGEGFSSYYWNKLGYEKPQLKVSYLKVFQPYQWVIGTGVYVDDSISELKMKIAKLITSYFYNIGKTKNNYFFILDEKGDTILNGGFPQLNGKSVWNFKDKKGHFFGREMVKVARDSQSRNGFVEYLWTHPSSQEEMTKLAYVQWFEPFEWVIATGIYLEDLGIEEMQQELQQKTYLIIQKIALSGSVFLLIGILMSISLVKILTKPLILAKNAAEEIAKGHFSQQISYAAKDEIGQLVDTLNSMAMQLKFSFDQLNHKNQQLVLLNQEKNEFLAIAAHDLKNPLSGILGLSENMLDLEGDISDEDRVEYLSMIKDSAERMFLLITNLLDVNALESGKIATQLSSTDILIILKETIHAYKERVKNKQLIVHLIAKEPFYLAYVDKHLVQQILDNLVSNAVKYSPFNKNIYLHLTHEEQSIRFEVRDEGEGLSIADQQKLFNKFQRLSTKPTAGEHSTGLGLFIVKKLVDAQNGKIWCKSEIGQGATFMVEFPLPS